MHRYHLTPKSTNAKTGAIPVSTTSSDTCPTSCPLKGSGCYAQSGPMLLHWRKLDAGLRGVSLDKFCNAIAALPEGQLWRHNQAGDLPGTGDRIDEKALYRLVIANQGRRGFTYTHKPLTMQNWAILKTAITDGFTINVSTNTLDEADKAYAQGLPTVTLMPDNTSDKVTLPSGARVVVCPAQTGKSASCAECQLCQRASRKVIVGFRAHGSMAKRVIKIAQG